MKRYQTCLTPNSDPVTIPGTTMTIPGLAPDLQTLMAAAVEGEPLPRTSEPLFDESEEAGQARVEVGNLPPEEILFAHLSASASREQAQPDGSESASPEEEAAASEAQQ